MLDGEKILLKGQGHRVPGMDPGDVVVVLHEEQHPRFKRKDPKSPNLLLREPLRVTAEAILRGRPALVRTLDGRELSVRLPAREASSSTLGGVQLVVPGEGLPANTTSGERGWLFVEVEVS
jgi:DnaJ-class molecular chaperone